MEKMKKYLAECIGTCVLVTCGCGYILTALAFGLVIVGMAYCVGNISGCHINPAVSLGVLIKGGMTGSEFVGYVLSQCAGSLLGSAILAIIFTLGGVEDKTGGFGANGLGGVNGSIAAGLVVEIVLTFIFVLTILGVTDSKAGHGSFGGLIIGLTLVLVHILGIGLTGTSVNPARSLFPAVFAAIFDNDQPIKELWVFIVGPFAGSALAAFTYKFLSAEK